MSKLSKPKKTLYILLIFTVFCAGVTTACIYNTLQIRKNENYGQAELITKIKTISLTEKYKTNAITIKTVEEKEGNILTEYREGIDSIYEYELFYDQISGLKNATIENRINDEIKRTAISLKSKLSENPKFERISISAHVFGNFSDVLSVQVTYSLIKSSDDFEYKYDSIGLNYRLDTGEKIEFADLFMKNTSIKHIVGQAIYEACAWEYSYDSEYMDGANFDNVDYSYIENQTFKLMAAYNRNPDANFYFSEKEIFLKIKEYEIPINMRNFYEDIAIYTAFTKDNLYMNENNQKDFYAFANTYSSNCFEEEKTKGNNFYYEIITYPEETKNDEVKKFVREQVNNKIDYYYKIAKQNPDKAYIVSVIYYYTAYDDSPISYHYSGYVTEMDFDYFKNNLDLILSEAKRQEMVELWACDYSMTDEKVEFYEEFSRYEEDYTLNNSKEQIFTKEDREAQERLYENV